jgi:hypothetical protein
LRKNDKIEKKEDETRKKRKKLNIGKIISLRKDLSQMMKTLEMINLTLEGEMAILE